MLALRAIIAILYRACSAATEPCMLAALALDLSAELDGAELLRAADTTLRAARWLLADIGEASTTTGAIATPRHIGLVPISDSKLTRHA